MATTVFDIETVGLDVDALPASVRDYLLRGAQKEADDAQRRAAEARIVDQMSFWPLTAKVVAVGLVDVESGRARAYFEGVASDSFDTEDGARCIASSEADALRAFWDDVAAVERVVTFNGRGFDVPFLMMRSAVNGVRPSRNFLAGVDHVDLLDELCFRGASRRFNLDAYCHAFGIDSPKQAGISGAEVGTLYKAGDLPSIVRYCLGDVTATAALYRKWHQTLSF